MYNKAVKYRGVTRALNECRTAALKFCKTCVAIKFVDDDDDEQRHIFTSLLNIWCWQSLLKITNTVLLLLVILCKTTSDVTQNYTMQIRQFSPFHSTVFTSIMF